MIDLSRLFRRDTPPSDCFGFAVVGLGRIADHFLKAVAKSPTVRATALVSGNPQKAAGVARRYNIAHTCGYADVASLRDLPDVHAVYLALPVSMHREFTALAALSGKHVLVEKPMAASSADCSAMIEDCRAANVLLSVAYRCPYDPLHQRVRDLIRMGALGEVQHIESQYGFRLQQDDWRFQRDLAGGGSLFDVGIYPLNTARFFLGQEPESHAAAGTTNASGLETFMDWTSTFPSGITAHCRSSYLEKLHDVLTVTGTAGRLRLDPAYTHTGRFHLQGQYTDPATGKPVTLDQYTPDTTPSHFRLEAEHLAHCARSGSPLLTPGEDGLHDLQAMEAIYAAAGIAN